MPKQITQAIILVVISLFVGSIDLLFQFAGITKQDTSASSLISLIVGVAITAILFVFMVRRHNWARWVFVVITLLSIPIILPVLVIEINSDLVGATSTTIQILLQASAVILLLRRPVGRWFKNKN